MLLPILAGCVLLGAVALYSRAAAARKVKEVEFLWTRLMDQWHERVPQLERRIASWHGDGDCYTYATFIATGHMISLNDDLQLLYRDECDFDEVTTERGSYLLFMNKEDGVVHQGIYLGGGKCMSKVGKFKPTETDIQSLTKIYHARVVVGVPSRIVTKSEALL